MIRTQRYFRLLLRNKLALLGILGQLLLFCLRLLKILRVDHLVGDIEFSTGDSANTGMAVGLFHAVKSSIRRNGLDITLRPDFSSTPAVQGEFEVRGRIRPWKIIPAILQLLFSPPVRTFIYQSIKIEFENLNSSQQSTG